MENITKTKIIRRCPNCFKLHEMEFDNEILQTESEKYKSGEYFQETFPTLTHDQKVFIEMGICKKCYDTAYRK